MGHQPGNGPYKQAVLAVSRMSGAMNNDDTSYENGGDLDDPRLEMFMLKVAKDDDDLSVVVRTQTWLESFLEKLIRGHFTDPAAPTKWFTVEYAKRLELALLLGALPRYFQKPLKLLAHMRNLFAHDPRTRLDDKLVEELYCSLTDTLKEHIANHAPPAANNNPNLSDAQTKLRAVANTLTNMTYFAWAYRKREAPDRELCLAHVAKADSPQLHLHCKEYKS